MHCWCSAFSQPLHYNNKRFFIEYDDVFFKFGDNIECCFLTKISEKSSGGKAGCGTILRKSSPTIGLHSSSGEGGNGLSWSRLYKSKYGNLSNAAKFVLHTKISFKFKLEVSLGGRIYRLLWIYTGCFFYCSALKCQPLKEISELFLPKND